MAPKEKEGEVIEEWDHHNPAEHQLEKLVAPQADSHKFPWTPYMILMFTFMHISGIYGLTFITSAKWSTLIFEYIYFSYGFMGITAGTHRYWSHRAFKAKLPLQIILMLAHSAVNQFSVLWWSQTHRQHHKYSDTDGDPVNSTRGFFYSHIGWLLVRRHPKALERRKFVNTSDLTSDPLLRFQKRYAFAIITLMSIILPVTLPLIWGESFTVAWHLNMLRLVMSYNILFGINSIGHRFGNKPYDKYLKATQTDLFSFIAFGEGYHNYHHSFPWDYRSGEFGDKWNVTTLFIEFFAKIGWAYDLKSVPVDIVKARAERNGDGSRVVQESH